MSLGFNELARLMGRDLEERRGRDQLRRRRVLRPIDATHIELDGRRLVNFASNDYLGLTHHPRVMEAVAGSIGWGAGSGAAGLISGYTELHALAERELARWKQAESAVLLPSGYQANLAAVQTLAGVAAAQGRAVRFLMDKLVHASLIDAVRGTGADVRVFPHNHLGKLQRLLEEVDDAALQVVITESIFSMDGDAADLAGIAELKQKHGFVLLVDEAHASGVYGDDGAGYAAEMGLSQAVDVSIVTLSKALGCAGGAVCASRLFCDSLLNHGRAYIYSTSVAPAVAAEARVAIEVIRAEPQRRQRVRELARRVRSRFDVTSAGPDDCPIIPVIMKNESAALGAADRLRDEGLLVVAVRPPTVPRGTSRLRITLSSEHTDQEVDRLCEAVSALR